MARDKQSDGKKTDMTQGYGGVGQDAYRIQYQWGPSGYSEGIVRGDGADWFGPLNPMNPVAPPEVAGRVWDFPSGYNLELVPRPYEPIKFSDMRGLADGYDILRMIIETRKDQMERLTWTVRPKTDVSGDPMCKDDDPDIQAIYDFFQTPDGKKEWNLWLRELLEDMFVIDAATLYCHKTKGGQLLGLEQIDGAGIKRVVDDWGRTPAPPVVAYQQILKGFPAINYDADQMLYLPRNTRVHKFYGYSPVEQIIMTVNIGLRRQLFQLEYFTSGNIPDALCSAPESWTPKQITDFQNSFDSMLAGNTAVRRRIKFLPGGMAKSLIPTKDIELIGKTDEWFARVCCFAFSIPPTPFISQHNRATAESAHDTAIEEGLVPVQNWVKRIIDLAIRKFWNRKDIEFAWEDDREVDQTQQEVVLTGYVKSGILKANEAREALGKEPDPAGDVLRVQTATGMVRLDVNDDAPTAGDLHQTNQDNVAASLKAKTDLAAQGKAPDGTEDGSAKEALPSKTEGAAGKAARPFTVSDSPNEPTTGLTLAKSVQQDWTHDPRIELLETIGDVEVWLVDGETVRDYWDIDYTEGANDEARPLWMPKNQIWLDNANPKRLPRTKLHELHERNEMMEFGVSYDTGHERANVKEQEATDHPETTDALLRIERDRLLRLQPPKQEKLAKRKRLTGLSHDTKAVKSGETRLSRAVRRIYRTLAQQASHAARHQLGIAKATEDEEPATPIAVEAIMQNIDWKLLVDPTEEQLLAVARDGAYQAMLVLGVSDDASIVDQTYTAAAEWARARAAELVGMKYNAAGELIPNPNADMAITDTIREDIRSTVADAIEEGLPAADLADDIEGIAGFSADRAIMVARTEIIRANNQGHMAAFRESGVVQMKEWSTSNNPEVCDECQANEDQGPIGLDEDFESGDSEPPGHPLCLCVVVASIEQADEEESDEDEEED